MDARNQKKVVVLYAVIELVIPGQCILGLVDDLSGSLMVKIMSNITRLVNICKGLDYFSGVLVKELPASFT